MPCIQRQERCLFCLSEDFPEAEAAAQKLADLTEGVEDSESG